MSTLQQIRSDTIAARKAKNPTASVLVTLVGEIDTKTKSFSPARSIAEEEVVAIVKKFLKGIDETINLLQGRGGQALASAQAERAALEGYLPAQMTEDEITVFARAKAGAGANMGQIMAALKSAHAGKYDGKLASQVVKQVVSA